MAQGGSTPSSFTIAAGGRACWPPCFTEAGRPSDAAFGDAALGAVAAIAQGGPMPAALFPNACVKVRARAPLRLGLAGGGTDLSPYCDLYGGAVLNATIERHAYASLTLGGDRVVLRACDLDHCETVEPDGLTLDGALSLHRAVCLRMAREFMSGALAPLTLETMIDAPPGSGLGSSSALVVAMVEAFRTALDLPLGGYETAHLAFQIEREELKLAGGRQDHYAAAFGGVNFIEFLPGDRVIVNPLRLPAAILNEVQASLVVAFTGQSRRSDAIISDQIAHVADKDAVALEGMHRLKDDATEMKLAMLRGDVGAMGAVMDRSWAAKKATSAMVTTPAIDRMWRAAHAAGALSGKVSGAGGGGFVMFLCDPARRSDVMRALKAEGGEPSTVSFSLEGATGWRVR